MKKIILQTLLQTLVAIVFLVMVWAYLYFATANELLVPSLFDSMMKMRALLASGVFWVGLGMSVLRALSAFAISFVFALIFSVIAYLVPSFARFFAPIVSALRSLPVLAVLLILLSVLGASEAPVAVAFLSLFPMLYTAILNALMEINSDVIDISRVHGASIFHCVFYIYLPLSAPSKLREVGATLSFSLKVIVSAEVLANTAKSLGGMMQEAKIYAEMPQLFALVFITFLLGLLFELSLSLVSTAVEKRVK